ncbi:hypothetical protein ATE92_2615 [Ulvibacter sp. MAR_2010_11]|uniref:hypothetical protein n=1 Tax=Ulvibacter sp. MAR_2010_11 TaxID=1250229 RepID=UPI000C2C167D|nr:hypothetical protein [Ulvibacter sp. MAR_2010_11]PKA84426.1 hypothetical protein ATE92_2615 [Ulvibacter sp. MAR_2010_11]
MATKPQNCISESEARTMYNNWTSRAMSRSGGMGLGDARDVIFSIEELEEYIKYVKDNHTGLAKPGIRIYFAANGPQPDASTVFLTPTLGVNTNSPNNYAIDSYNRGGTGWPPNIF